MRDLILGFLEWLGEVPDWVLFSAVLVLLPVVLVGSWKNRGKR